MQEVDKSLPEFLRQKREFSSQYTRTCRLDIGQRQNILHVLGTTLKANLTRSAPPKTKYFSVKCTPNVEYIISPLPKATSYLSPVPLMDNSVLLISMKEASDHSQNYTNDKLSVWYYGTDKNVLDRAVLHLTAVEISLDVDADRDGVVEKSSPNKDTWKWGPNGHGAILLVNCDSESVHRKRPDSEREHVILASDVRDMSEMVLRTKGPPELPEGYKLVLHICQSDAEKCRVFICSGEHYPLVLSSAALSTEIPYLGNDEIKFYVEGTKFPDKDFDGLIKINLSLLEPICDGIPETPIFTDTVVFRVAPWIMTPNTLKPLEVFVCSTKDNYKFLEGMKSLVVRSGCKLNTLYEYFNRGDRWMQDELEFGYIDSPHHSFPVVLDSPRDGQLNDFPYHVLLGPDFGYVTRVPKRKDVSSLDSFGNLEVSPPVTVNGKHYPLGRIIIGVAFPTAANGRNMTKVVQDFLWAQAVQKPIALYSDWLEVGHVDEFMSFVPAKDRKGFRLLLASPDAAYKLFKNLQNDGHGYAKLFEDIPEEGTITVNEILTDRQLQNENNYVQSCIDWNRDVLKKELELDDEDIIDLPILFKLVVHDGQYRALAYYPDMVNMIVLGKNLGIPKPFGPKVNGECALEQRWSH
ncbi:hypothetical protein WMY93_012477 [Mugilogobius chulae]|uniref:Protein-arginine deiminase n=1 Tax=Mugilogobius chulae TaxID=88201 RepID=A0AAW0PB69_9GOBI